jgi:hypothetical protein
MTRFWNNLLQAQDQKIGKPNNLNVPGASNAQNQKIGKSNNHMSANYIIETSSFQRETFCKI